MLKNIKKTVLKMTLTAFLLIVLAMAPVNIVFAADGEDYGCNADKNYAQTAPENQKNNINYDMKDIGGFVWSVITPDEAWAATDPVSCVEQCTLWNYDGDYPCCVAWNDGTAQYCKDTWGCKSEE